MSIYEYDEEKTMRMFREEWYKDGQIQGCIEVYLDFKLPSETIIKKLMTHFQLSESEAQEYLNQYIEQNP